MPWTKADYERLGDYVVSARVRLGMERLDLATGAEISLRTLADIENGELAKRKAFSAETLEAIGLCLGWQPGSWRRVLNGGEPITADSPAAPTADPAAGSGGFLLEAFAELNDDERVAVESIVTAFLHNRGAIARVDISHPGSDHIELIHVAPSSDVGEYVDNLLLMSGEDNRAAAVLNGERFLDDHVDISTYLGAMEALKARKQRARPDDESLTDKMREVTRDTQAKLDDEARQEAPDSHPA